MKRSILAVFIIIFLGILLFLFFCRGDSISLDWDNSFPFVWRDSTVITKKDTFVVNKNNAVEIWYFQLKQDWKNYTLVFEDGLDYKKGFWFTMLGKFKNIFWRETMLLPVYEGVIPKKVEEYLERQEKLGERESFSITFWPDDIKDFWVNGLTCGLTDISVFNDKPCIFIWDLKERIVYVTKETRYGGLEELEIKIK